jgi:hypothetical protein
MSIFDALQNMTPDQTQALLAASGQILQQSGDPSKPFGLGQAVGSGITAFQGSLNDAKRRRMEAEQQAQLQRIRAMQIRDAESDYTNQEALRARANALTAFRTKMGPQGMQQAPGQGQGGDMSAIPMPGSTPMQSTPGMMQPQQQVQQAAGGFGGGQNGVRQALAAQRLAEAQAHRQAGFVPEADALEKQALDMMPKVKNWQEVRHEGKTLYAPYFEDGSSGAPVPYEVAQKLEFRDAGGTVAGLDPYTGKPVSSITKTESADARAARAQSERHFQAQQDTPTYMDTAGGIVALPKKLAKGQVPTATPVLDAQGNQIEKKANVPQYVVEGIINNAKSLQSIDAALASLKTPEGKNAVGWKGYLPNSLLNRVSPEGTETRANISDVGSLILHDRSGAAVTAAESPRLMPFIPLATDDNVTAAKKLARFKQAFEAETNNLTFQFPQAKKLAEEAAKNSAPPAQGGNAGTPQVIDFGSLK